MELLGTRYRPMKDVTAGGIIIVNDATPNQPVDLVQPVAGNCALILR